MRNKLNKYSYYDVYKEFDSKSASFFISKFSYTQKRVDKNRKVIQDCLYEILKDKKHGRFHYMYDSVWNKLYFSRFTLKGLNVIRLIAILPKHIELSNLTRKQFHKYFDFWKYFSENAVVCSTDYIGCYGCINEMRPEFYYQEKIIHRDATRFYE